MTEKWRTRRAGYVQGRLIGAGYKLGPEFDMPLEARELVAQALIEFEENWPSPGVLESCPACGASVGRRPESDSWLCDNGHTINRGIDE